MASVTKIHATLRSQTLDFNTDVNILLPEKPDEDVPVLYLLHGMHGDYSSWLSGSAIGRYARMRNIAVVMPSAANSFYCNMKYGERYFDYITEELPAFLTKNFPRISQKREKTFIAGLSMGGYGALKLALRNPDRYAACASLSGCLDLALRMNTSGVKWEPVAIANWGENYREAFPNSKDDLLYLIDTFPKDKPKPRIFFTCGTEDSLYKENQSFRRHVEGKGFETHYDEGPGIHDWVFWDHWILPAIDWMIGSV